jgi:hypothetical protein
LFRLLLTAASATAFGGAQFSIKKPFLPTVSPRVTRTITTHGAFECCCLKATPPGRRDVDIQAIDLNELRKARIRSNELRKAGVLFTKSTRTLQLEHEAELDDLELQIGSLNGQIKGLKEEKECRKIAFRFLTHYTLTGALKLILYDQRRVRAEQSNEVTMVYPNYKHDDDFDEESLEKCFAKHGFEYIEHTTYYGCAWVVVKFGILDTSEESGGTESII